MNTLDFILLAVGISIVIVSRIAQKSKKKAEFRQLLLADSNQQLAESVVIENVPSSLKVLIPYAKKYSLGDDFLRTQLESMLSNKEKKN